MRMSAKRLAHGRTQARAHAFDRLVGTPAVLSFLTLDVQNLLQELCFPGSSAPVQCGRCEQRRYPRRDELLSVGPSSRLLEGLVSP